MKDYKQAHESQVMMMMMMMMTNYIFLERAVSQHRAQGPQIWLSVTVSTTIFNTGQQAV